ncbi:hypothetical protein GLUCOINTEAF2_0202645 [Komagataeibacter intermedius AF2]|uniref:Uncharacterized protein n=1 Tax=Komagataeibacter intermedius AF2 TaxID=1458464 RepID=A0A0N0MFC0_9PROT|nr:hypothetical protein [Komagataeibacter intermedius]KPH86594.1 hypothetical protein GLUCOINTEAF2_0202645 [Komagataeibacter intermedius AF2]
MGNSSYVSMINEIGCTPASRHNMIVYSSRIESLFADQMVPFFLIDEYLKNEDASKNAKQGSLIVNWYVLSKFPPEMTDIFASTCNISSQLSAKITGSVISTPSSSDSIAGSGFRNKVKRIISSVSNSFGSTKLPSYIVTRQDMLQLRIDVATMCAGQLGLAGNNGGKPYEKSTEYSKPSYYQQNIHAMEKPLKMAGFDPQMIGLIKPTPGKRERISKFFGR